MSDFECEALILLTEIVEELQSIRSFLEKTEQKTEELISKI